MQYDCEVSRSSEDETMFLSFVAEAKRQGIESSRTEILLQTTAQSV